MSSRRRAAQVARAVALDGAAGRSLTTTLAVWFQYAPGDAAALDECLHVWLSVERQCSRAYGTRLIERIRRIAMEYA